MDTVRRGSAAPSPWLGGLSLADHGGSLLELARAAGCAAWSPFWRNLAAADVAEAHRLGLTVIPWTVNDPQDMARVIDRGRWPDHRLSQPRPAGSRGKRP